MEATNKPNQLFPTCTYLQCRVCRHSCFRFLPVQSLHCTLNVIASPINTAQSKQIFTFEEPCSFRQSCGGTDCSLCCRHQTPGPSPRWFPLVAVRRLRPQRRICRNFRRRPRTSRLSCRTQTLHCILLTTCQVNFALLGRFSTTLCSRKTYT